MAQAFDAAAYGMGGDPLGEEPTTRLTVKLQLCNQSGIH